MDSDKIALGLLSILSFMTVIATGFHFSRRLHNFNPMTNPFIKEQITELLQSTPSHHKKSRIKQARACLSVVSKIHLKFNENKPIQIALNNDENKASIDKKGITKITYIKVLKNEMTVLDSNQADITDAFISELVALGKKYSINDEKSRTEFDSHQIKRCLSVRYVSLNNHFYIYPLQNDNKG